MPGTSLYYDVNINRALSAVGKAGILPRRIMRGAWDVVIILRR